MNLLKRSLIEKAGYENGFENNYFTEDFAVILSSARHPATAKIRENSEGDGWLVEVTSVTTKSLAIELNRTFVGFPFENDSFLVSSIGDLSNFLHRASALAQALPNQAVARFERSLKAATADVPLDIIKGTEIERIVRQRIGQDTFRQAMLDYWGGSCAVTGISVSEVLRASHAKPWAECESDFERLDVFNGFLLCANLDALFDRFLISFDDKGILLLSSAISVKQQGELGLDRSLTLRWLASEHLPYLEYHREVFTKIQKLRR